VLQVLGAVLAPCYGFRSLKLFAIASFTPAREAAAALAAVAVTSKGDAEDGRSGGGVCTSTMKESHSSVFGGMVEPASMSLVQEIPVRERRRSEDVRRSEERCRSCIVRTLPVSALRRLSRC
jgi:hypothetical protein